MERQASHRCSQQQQCRRRAARSSTRRNRPAPACARLQLIKSGERERLKALLREKLTECGWRDEVKARCRGAPAAWQQLGSRAVVLAVLLCRNERQWRPVTWTCSSSSSSETGSRAVAGACSSTRAHTHLRAPSLALPPCALLRQKRAEFIASRGQQHVTAEEIVRFIRPEGRAAVPDNVKAELLSRIKTFILSL